ncbi:hypothetical protein R80B4_00344 [Fibrobacteres bacterium R8-0-B4]
MVPALMVMLLTMIAGFLPALNIVGEKEAGTIEQQAMFVMFFFVMVFILMSGLFTPIASMPDWAQNITAFNPLKYLMQVMRMVYLKGSSFSEMIPQFLALSAFAVVLNGWAILCYKKSS